MSVYRAWWPCFPGRPPPARVRRPSSPRPPPPCHRSWWLSSEQTRTSCAACSSPHLTSPRGPRSAECRTVCVCGVTQPLQSCMVTWTRLDPSNELDLRVSCHFSNSIFDMFFTGQSWDKRANRKLKHFTSIFEVKSSSTSDGF